ncbi:MAG: CRISPR-associated helicase Cas3' [Clostridiales bacterium]|jgi:CRISPR-associated endonuclease/helicase Cas3|nr:CRISPR-associated helicase Cas3' [Clostridiales bacterium]
MTNIYDQYFARKNNNGKQLLRDHLDRVAEIASSFSNCGNISMLSGLLHDLGKATQKFQAYLLDGGVRGSVVHSIQGAIFLQHIDNSNQSLLLRELLSLSIVGHHNTLKDCVSPDGESVFWDRLATEDNQEYELDECTQFAQIELQQLNTLFKQAQNEIGGIVQQLKNSYKNKQSMYFALGLFVKYIYSCLVDADRYDAYLFDVDKQYIPPQVDWQNLIDVFESKLARLGTNQSQISQIRTKISNKCKEAAVKDTGIYQLSVPTGGGKTLSSLRFALHHARVKSKKRIVYVIPYLSIIEQTSKVVRDVLDLHNDSNNILLEHHSNIVSTDDKSEGYKRSLAISRWDNPIIITTMVQFLDTVMSGKASDLRKLHNMQDAVIVFDEIQSLPMHSIHLFNEAVSFLATVLNTTVLLCTATQPLIGKTLRKNLLLANDPNLIDGVEGDFDNLKRTIVQPEIEMNIDRFVQFVGEKLYVESNCLVIVNTKSVARKVFQQLQEQLQSTCAVYHLSTSMCSAHRFDILNSVKSHLSQGERVVLVSTQLIEAGVDISFGCVVRSMAGLDSIAQAGGRCNRNGESDEPKCVYAVPLKDENLDRLKDIKCGKQNAIRVIRENPKQDYLSQAMLDKFYKYYFTERQDLMDFQLNNGTVYQLLSTNDIGTDNYTNRTGKRYQHILRQAFDTASQEYNVIANNTETVVVYYNQSHDLIAKYQDSHWIGDKLAIIRQLQKYSVSLFRDTEYKLLYNSNAISVLDEEFGVKVLNMDNYSRDYGVTCDANLQDLIV